MNIEPGREGRTSASDDDEGATNPLDESARHVESLRAWSTHTVIEYGVTPSAATTLADGHRPDSSMDNHDHKNLCACVEPMFAEAANPAIGFVRLQQIHTEIVAMGCPACVGAFQMEMKIRSVLAVSCCRESVPEHLSHRIVEQISRIDLSEVDVSDIDF